jgi:outer membrane protein assembly factor BamB
LTGTFTTAASPTLANWPQNHFGPDATGFQPNETTIGVNNVSSLSQKWTYPTSAPDPQAPLVENGVLYEELTTGNGQPNQIEAFDASGKSCSGTPVSCAALWTSTVFAKFTGMTIADGEVFVDTFDGLLVFDANGNDGCTGTPKVCAPIWEDPAFSGEGTPVATNGPNGLVYIPGSGGASPLSMGGAFVAAFDVNGTGCPVIGRVKTCAPLWTTTGVPPSQSYNKGPAVANGVLFINSGGFGTASVLAFDATGNSCSGTPKVCAPLWTGPIAGSISDTPPAVANGTVYVGGSVLSAFDVNGTGCPVIGGVKTCAPLWTAPSGGSGGTPAVANGVVYTVGAGGVLSAFDATGNSCSGTPKVCAPLWVGPQGGGNRQVSSSPAVANGLVYFVSDDGTIHANDATGSVDCSISNSIKTCNPLWTAASVFGSPSIANGVVYVGQDRSNTLAYSL